MALRVVIAEDEELLRRQIVKIVSSFEDFEVVASCETGAEFLKTIKRIKHEIALVDIFMPGMTGIEVVKAVRDSLPETEFIFITAHEEFIRDAVELYAADYIQKPFDEERLIKTLNRLRKRLIIGEKSIEFKVGKEMAMVRERDLYFVEAFYKKTKVYTEDEEFVSDYTLGQVEEILDMDRFFKTSRSFLVNINKVNTIRPYNRSSYEVIFKNKNCSAFLSKWRYEDFRARIKAKYMAKEEIASTNKKI